MPAAEFIFDEKTHSGTLNGRFCPSVTTILAENGFINTSVYPESAKIRGKYVHDLIQFHNEGDLDESEAIRLGLKGYVDSWREFVAKFKVNIIEIEKRLYHPTYCYTGQYDLLCERNGGRFLVDYKSGPPELWHPWQLGAYLELYNFHNKPVRQVKRAGVYLKADGSMAEWIDYEDPFDGPNFLALCAATHLRRRHGICNR